MKISLAKGLDSIEIQIPDKKISAIVTGTDIPGISHKILAETIEQGILTHTPKEIGNKKIALIIPDDTRAWARGDLFVPVIVKTLENLGVARQDITILIALGTHADLLPETFKDLAGEYCAENIRILNSANKNQDRLAHIGTTFRKTQLQFTKEAWQADHIIIFGGVLHHMAAGYGGGRKYILPGIAGFDSIQQNHSLTIRDDGSAHPMVRQGVLEGNPVNEDMVEAAQIFLKNKTCTYAAVAANGSGDLFHAAVGDLEQTFTESCKKLDQACCVQVDQKADFALISTGGHRTDTQLYQATKALFNAVNIVKKGGSLLFVAGCSQGVGNDTFANVLTEYRECPEKIGKQLAAKFNMPAYVAFRVLDILKRFQVTLVSDMPEKIVRQLGFSFTDNIDHYIKNLIGKGCVIPFAENILPAVKEP